MGSTVRVTVGGLSNYQTGLWLSIWPLAFSTLVDGLGLKQCKYLLPKLIARVLQLARILVKVGPVFGESLIGFRDIYMYYGHIEVHL